MSDERAEMCPRCDRPLAADGKCPSCDERKSGRMGDATRGRIADLADGWSMNSATTTPTPVLDADEAGALVDLPTEEDTSDEKVIPTAKVRALSDTLALLEEDTLDPTREKPPAREPPARAKRPSNPPPIPADAKVTVSGELKSSPPAPRRLAPPKPNHAAGRKAEASVEVDISVDDTASAPASASASPSTSAKGGVRAGTLTLPPELKKREEDTTFDARSPVAEPTPTPAMERIIIKGRGLLGDIAYVWSVFSAKVSGRREIASMRERLGFERAARQRRLAELAKLAASDLRLDEPALVEARHRLRMIDEDVARHQKAVNEAEAEAKRAEEALAAKLAELDKQNTDLEKRVTRLERDELAPLEAEATARKKRFDELKEALADTSKLIGTIEKRLARATVAEPDLRADAEADLASARAEKQTLARDEPTLVEAINDLAPKVEAKRKERDDLRADIKRNKEEAARETERLEFQAEAARARKAESERSKKAVAVSKDQELVALGETIDRERPRALQLRLRPADEHGAAIAILERRILELEDAARVVDRAALTRGIVWLSLLTLAVVVAVAFLVSRGPS